MIIRALLTVEFGTIEPGKSADIIAVAGDPVADVQVLKSVAFVSARAPSFRRAISRTASLCPS